MKHYKGLNIYKVFELDSELNLPIRFIGLVQAESKIKARVIAAKRFKIDGILDEDLFNLIITDKLEIDRKKKQLQLEINKYNKIFSCI
jgi:hypothetical protein